MSPTPVATAATVEAAPLCHDVRPRTAAARLLVWLVQVYQGVRTRPPVCRYQPTCSNYALGAVEVHGARRGTWLAIKRIGRCHPWGGSGWDPVPSLEERGV
jgi:putative membrane protein insertion efficiency factor